MAGNFIDFASSRNSRTAVGARRRLAFACLLVLVAIGGIFAGYNFDIDRISAAVSSLRQPSLPMVVHPDSSTPVSGIIRLGRGVSSDRPATRNLISRPMPICGSDRRINCVVDGDTIWVDREKIRLESMNAPEVNGACNRERELAGRATRRLSQILSSRAFSITRNGVDRYGRTLATVRTADEDVGLILVREGLAHVWQGRKQNWC